MTQLRVWAPEARAVEVRACGQAHPMARAARGWWEVDVPGAGLGADYLFSVDGGDPRPDPRSPFQPAGVDGPSRVIDHFAFEWTKDAPGHTSLAKAVVYELHVGTFTAEGTFEAAISRLDHLVDLGVTAVELLPVAEFSGRHGWGYDGVDLYAPHHAYGGPDGLKRLVDALHERGLAAILDVVYNHLGPAGNYLSEFGPYFTDRYNTPWGDAVNLDGPHSDGVRDFFIENALMWLRDYRFDGLRIDAVHAIYDRSALHFLEEMEQRVEELGDRLGRKLFLIAESDLNDPRLITPRDAGGYGLDAQWSDDLHHALHAVLTGEASGYYSDFGRLAHVARALECAYVYDGTYSKYRKRVHGRPAQGLPGDRFLGYLQNHDQIGNRARGERSSHLMSSDLLKVGAALVLTAPFVPMLFQGEEWGASTPWLYFTDHPDPDLGRAVREGRRREFAAFGWDPEDIPDPQSHDTFMRSKLNWAELEGPEHAEMLAWHKELIRLRASVPELTDGRLGRIRTSYDEDERWLMVERDSFTLACNLSAAPRAVPVPAARRTKLLTASKGVGGAGESVELPPESVALWLAPARDQTGHEDQGDPTGEQ